MVHMGRKRNTYRVLFQKREGKVLLRTHGHGLMDNIKCIFHKCSGRNGFNLSGSG